MNRLFLSRFTIGLFSLVDIFGTPENIITSLSKDTFFKVSFTRLNFLFSWTSTCSHRLFMHLNDISFSIKCRVAHGYFMKEAPA